MIYAKDVKKVREITGCGMRECKSALEKTKGDILLAWGYLASYSLSVLIDGDREAWNMSRAKAWKENYIKENGEINE